MLRRVGVLFLVLVLLLGVAVASRLPQGFSYTPAGPLPDECIHTVPSGSIIDRHTVPGRSIVINSLTGEQTLLTVCNFTINQSKWNKRGNDYDGWLAYTTFQDTVGFQSFLGFFSVPQYPQNVPEVLYLFTGLQNVNWIPIVDPEPPVFDIIQPVLQYPGDYGNYWSVKSWYVTLDTGAIASTEIQVPVGDIIFGNMTKVGSSSWYIAGVSSHTIQTSALTVRHKERLSSQPWAYNTLECYGCADCTYQPPNPVQFTKLTLWDIHGQRVTPNWVTSVSPNPVCQTNAARVNSPSSVTITFQGN